jgi:hypothetical protein
VKNQHAAQRDWILFYQLADFAAVVRVPTVL